MHIVNNTIDLQISSFDLTGISRTPSVAHEHKVGCDTGLTLSLQWVYSVVTVFIVLCGLTGSSLSCLLAKICQMQTKCVKYNFGKRHMRDMFGIDQM